MALGNLPDTMLRIVVPFIEDHGVIIIIGFAALGVVVILQMLGIVQWL